MGGGQITCGNWFSPSTLWVPGMEYQLLGLVIGNFTTVLVRGYHRCDETPWSGCLTTDCNSPRLNRRTALSSLQQESSAALPIVWEDPAPSALALLKKGAAEVTGWGQMRGTSSSIWEAPTSTPRAAQRGSRTVQPFVNYLTQTKRLALSCAYATQMLRWVWHNLLFKSWDLISLTLKECSGKCGHDMYLTVCFLPVLNCK